MSQQKKQFGVWMDTQHATIAGRATAESNEWSILGHVKNDSATGNSSEKAENNAAQAGMQKYFKEIAAVMVNIDELHLTGTGTAQEQFAHFLKETPQYKNTVSTESTSNKMSDEKLLEFIAEKF